MPLDQISLSFRRKVSGIPKRIRTYCRKKSKFKEAESLSGLYDFGYYHGDAYEDYTFEKLNQMFRGKIRYVKKFREHGKLLDVGCALGFFAKIAQDEGFDAYGIDFSEYATCEARKILGDRVFCGDIEKGLPFRSDFFDVITAWDLLEHLRAPDLFLRRLGRVLKEGGLVFITTVNYDSLMSKLMKNNWIFADPLHLTHTITSHKLKRWLDDAELKPLSIYSDTIALKNPSEEIGVEIISKVLGSIERMLNFQMSVVLRMFRCLNLGDVLICVAKKS